MERQLLFPTTRRWLAVAGLAYLAVTGAILFDFRRFLSGELPLAMLLEMREVVLAPLVVMLTGLFSLIKIWGAQGGVSFYQVKSAGLLVGRRDGKHRLIPWESLSYVHPADPHYFFARAVVSDGTRVLSIERPFVPGFEELCARLRQEVDRRRQLLVL